MLTNCVAVCKVAFTLSVSDQAHSKDAIDVVSGRTFIGTISVPKCVVLQGWKGSGASLARAGKCV